MRNTIRRNLFKILCWGLSAIAAAVIILCIGIFSLTDDPKALLQFFMDYRIIKDNYYKDISDGELFENAATGMVSGLGDPHSVRLSGKKFDAFMQSTNGEYGGIGVVIGMGNDDNIRILQIFPGSSAEKAKLQTGDIITSVDGENVHELGLEATSEKVRGESGTHVKIAVKREGEELSFDVERSHITLPTVQSEIIKEHIGYVHIFSFAKHTSEELEKQLTDLKSKGANKLIVDLRMNPGGMLDAVVAVANQLLTKGTVVSYHTKSGNDKKFDIAGVENVMPMVILIDKNSASASEIFAGAVQDKKEGIIMGETSYGKGTVQVIIQDGSHSALKISVAEYRTAAGRSIDKIGIVPDVKVEQTGQIFNREADNVLQKAIEILSH